MLRFRSKKTSRKDNVKMTGFVEAKCPCDGKQLEQKLFLGLMLVK